MDINHSSHFILLIKVFVSLLLLTVLTVVASKIHFNSTSVNIIVAILIATLKASTVFYYFMHLKWEDTITKCFALLAFPFLFLLLGITLWDMALKVQAENIF